MNHLESKIKGPLKMFMNRFGGYMREDEYKQFFSNKRLAGKDTYLSSDFCLDQAGKLSSIILEEYGVRGKLQGNVILLYPEPSWDVPFFMFQMGGNKTQTIALLDISPTHPGMDYSALLPVYEKYRDALGIRPAPIEWVTRISSPYTLHAQYEQIDRDLFMEAAAAYLDVWIRHYYEPARKLDNPRDIDIVTNALYKYKHVLHANDPAYGIWEKSWGRPLADAFHYIETCEHPALPMPEDADPYAQVWDNRELNVMWTLAAQSRFEQDKGTPEQRATIEQRARAAHFGMITPEVYERLGATERPVARAGTA